MTTRVLVDLAGGHRLYTQTAIDELTPDYLTRLEIMECLPTIDVPRPSSEVKAAVGKLRTLIPWAVHYANGMLRVDRPELMAYWLQRHCPPKRLEQWHAAQVIATMRSGG